MEHKWRSAVRFLCAWKLGWRRLARFEVEAGERGCNPGNATVLLGVYGCGG